MADDVERDRRSGLLRVLDAIASVGDQVADLRRSVDGLAARVDALEHDAGKPAPAPAPIDVTQLRRTVQDAVAQLEVPSTADQVQALVNTAMSVIPPPRVDPDAVGAAVRAAVAAIPTHAVDLTPVLDAVRRYELALDGLASAPDLRAVRDELRALVDSLDLRRIRTELDGLAAGADLAALGDRVDALAAGTDLAAVRDHVAEVSDAVHGLQQRIAALPARAETPAQNEVDDALVDLVRRTVAASHRALVSQLRALLEGSRDVIAAQVADAVAESIAAVVAAQPGDAGPAADDAATVSIDDVARDVEAIRRAIERAGLPTR